MHLIRVSSKRAHRSLGVMRHRRVRPVHFRKHADIVCEEVVRRVRRAIPEGQHVIGIPILRSGLSFLAPAMRMFPEARWGVVGLERKEFKRGVKIRRYYWKLPPLDLKAAYLVFDPMFATGETMAYVVERLLAAGVPPAHIYVVTCITTPVALTRVAMSSSDIRIRMFTVAVDPKLDHKFYIVPGLGDWGERYFGTVTGSGLSWRHGKRR